MTASPNKGIDIRKRLIRIPVAAVNDVFQGRNVAAYVLPHQIRPLVAGQRLVGPVLTIEGEIADGLTVDQSLLEWSQLLSRIPSGVVAMCQPNTRDMALMGELSGRALKLKGVLGYVVDGACRDVELLKESGFDVWCTHMTPADIAGRWHATRLGEPIQIGDVRISSGDWVTGDQDGAVVIPRAVIEDVTDEAEALVGTENDMREAILSGMDPEEAYQHYRKF